MADTLLSKLARIETTVRTLNKRAEEGLQSPKMHAELQTLAGTLGEGSEEPVAVVSASPTNENPVASTPVATPSLDTLQSNSTLADEILNRVDQTDVKIDQLVTAGRKFNASRAKADLYVVASKVAEILNNVDLAQPWVAQDLTQLANEADRLHSLFESAKV